ncbi:MAG: amidohydrolase family protein [Actinomycetota bacterium]|nr:amidohydrolase family protein [Actinomycetota bacterium]
MPAVLYSADVVCPMTRPVIGDGGVLVVDGRIAAVEQAATLRPSAGREHRVAGVLLPGLVNAHTHLEHSDATSLVAGGPHLSWTRTLSGLLATWPPQRWGRSAHRGVLSSLRAGTTAVGDVVSRGPAVPAACRAGLVGDSWVQVAMVDRDSSDVVLEQLAVSLGLPAEGRRVGIAADSPAVLGSGVLQSLADLAKRSDVPLHLHCAETEGEVTAVRDGRGPLAEEARAAGMSFEWLDAGAGAGGVTYLERLGGLTDRTTLAHAVVVEQPEAALLAKRGIAVVCCPRADAQLQAGQAPLERFAAAGTPLALGTESPAAVGDLDVLAEAAAWVSLARQRGLDAWPHRNGKLSLPEAAVRLATVDGAAAMGWGQQAGMLATGRRADLVGVELVTSAATVWQDLISSGAGRQVLTVRQGVRVARRASADEPWPEPDDDSWRP